MIELQLPYTNAVPKEVENVKNLNAFHRNYLKTINNVSK